MENSKIITLGESYEIVKNMNFGGMYQLIEDKVEHLIQIFNQSLDYTKQELENYFTVKEAQFIIMAFTSNSFNQGIPAKYQLKSSVLGEYHYGYLPEGTGDEDVQELLEKIDKLSEIQAFAVIHMTYEFFRKYKFFEEDGLKKTFMITK